MAAKPTAKREPETADAAPAIGGEVTVGGVTVVPLDGVGKPEMVGTGVPAVGAGAVGPTWTEVKVGTSAGQAEMVTVMVAGGVGTDASGVVASSDEVGTTGASVVVGTAGASVVEQGTVRVVSLPIGQSVTVGWQLVMVLTMVV
jgi:hypothetical protein